MAAASHGMAAQPSGLAGYRIPLASRARVARTALPPARGQWRSVADAGPDVRTRRTVPSPDPAGAFLPREGGCRCAVSVTARAASRRTCRDRRCRVAVDNRLRQILAALADGQDTWSSAGLCTACPAIVGVTGASVMLMSGEVPSGSLCISDEVSHLIEDLQYTLGEGPCVDAYRQDVVVAEPDLANPATRRWPAFTPPVLEAGARAVFGFPLRCGAVRLGALNLYRDTPGPLTGDQHADALVVADVAARWVLEAQAGAPPGTVAESLEVGADFHFSVHNAAGVISAQEGISVTEALIRLRAHAFSADRLLADVARDVIARTLRLR